MLRVCCVIALAAVPICFGGDLIIRSSFSGKIDHKRFAFTITHADVAKTPAWSPGAKRPPLSRRQAEDIARNELRKYTKNLGEWRLREIDLLDMGDPRHRFYHVGFERIYPKPPNGGEQDQFNVPVFMDGRVVKPRVFLID